MSTPLSQTLGALMLALALFVPSLACAGEAEWQAQMDAGTSAYRAGDYRAATARFEAALREAESFGTIDPRLAESLNDLAVLYRAQGRYTDAEPLLWRSLGIREKALSPDHADVAESLNNLALLYGGQGRYGDAEPLYRRSLGILEKALGPDHPNVATVLNNLAELYREQGRNVDAESLYRRSLGIREKAFGPDHAHIAESLNNLAMLYQGQGLYADAELLYRRSLAIYEKAKGPDHLEVATSLKNLAELYRVQGRYGDAEPLYRRSLGILEKRLGPDHLEVATSLNNLAGIYKDQGRYADGELLYLRSLAIRENVLGPDRPEVAASLNNLAGIYIDQGRYADAEPLYQRSLSILERTVGPDHPAVATSLNNLAGNYRDQGRYADAELLYLRSLAIREKVLGPDHPDVATSLNSLAVLYDTLGRFADAEPLLWRSLRIREKALSPDHPSVAISLNNLASLYQAQGRYADAELLYLRSLAIREKVLGPDHPDVATSLNSLAVLYDTLSRFADAEPLYRRSLGIRERGLGPDHPYVASSLSNLAGNYQDQGRYADAELLYLRSLAIREKVLGPDHPDVATSLNGLAVLYGAQGRYEDAELFFRRSFGIREMALGPDHPNVANSLGNQAVLYRMQGKIDEALTFARRMNASLGLRFTPDKGASHQGAVAEQRTRARDFELHVALLAEILERRPPMRAEATREGFGIAQLARASGTADQVAKMAARYAAGSDALAQLARKRQDALARLEQLDSRIVKAAGQRGNEALAATLRAEEAEVSKTIAELDARLEREYPQYRELTNPKPLELAAAQKLLAGDEALALLLVSDKESFLWALRRNDAGFFKLAITRTELVEMVKKLRTQLDLGAGEPERILAQPFDVASAHELYRKIFAPAEALFAGAKQLIFVPDGAMQSLPPGVLVTEAPAKPVASLAELAQVPWLAKKYAITVLPAASSLRALRQFAKIPVSQEPFSGFGDPVLEGTGDDARKGNVAALYSRGTVADANEVRKLARLPESAGELRAIAAALNAPAASIRLGAAATERAVKEADLTRYRNLAFATHGLMAGDFKGLAEPALVLTPPAKGSELDDGLLTAGEISQLKLDADWVVLSACNTAAPDGTPGAEGLSGLARAFFYAGARSLLVSHWAVSSDAAVALTTRMFDESAKGISKAEALQRSMLALMARTDKPYFAHPALWAPFVVVGEGNTGWEK